MIIAPGKRSAARGDETQSRPRLFRVCRADATNPEKEIFLHVLVPRAGNQNNRKTNMESQAKPFHYSRPFTRPSSRSDRPCRFSSHSIASKRC